MYIQNGYICFGRTANPLSSRDCEILAALAAGHSNKEIAYRYALKEATVRNCVAKISHLTGLNRVQLAVWVTLHPEVLRGAAVAFDPSPKQLEQLWASQES